MKRGAHLNECMIRGQICWAESCSGSLIMVRFTAIANSWFHVTDKRIRFCFYSIWRFTLRSVFLVNGAQLLCSEGFHFTTAKQIFQDTGLKVYSFSGVLPFPTVQLSVTFSNRYLCKGVCKRVQLFKKAVLENSVFIEEKNHLWGMYKTVKKLKITSICPVKLFL